mgnify:FL=1
MLFVSRTQMACMVWSDYNEDCDIDGVASGSIAESALLMLRRILIIASAVADAGHADKFDSIAAEFVESRGRQTIKQVCYASLMNYKGPA